MQFLRPLRDRIRRREITTAVRLWQRPHVKVAAVMRFPPGEIVVTKVNQAYFFFVVNRKGTLTHAATGLDSGPSVCAGSKRKRGSTSRTASVNRS